MGKIYKLSDKNGNVLYPMTIGDAIAVDGATLTKKITTEATQTARGMMSAEDKKKLDGIATGATANTGTVTGVTIKAGTGIAVDDQTEITTSGERTVSLAASGVAAGTYKSSCRYLRSCDKRLEIQPHLEVTVLHRKDCRRYNHFEANPITLDDDSIMSHSTAIRPLTKRFNGYHFAEHCAKAVDERNDEFIINQPSYFKSSRCLVDGALVSVLKYQELSLLHLVSSNSPK